MMGLGVVLLGSIIFGTLCFLDWHANIFHQIGKFSFIIFLNTFPISCSFSFPSGTPLIRMLVCMKFSQRLHSLSLCFWILFSSCCSDSMSFSYLCSESLIWFLASSTALLVPCKFFFISLSVCNLNFCLGLFYDVEVPDEFLEHRNNQCFDRLLISILFSSFSGVLFCSFIWAMFLCLLILAASLCLFLCIS